MNDEFFTEALRNDRALKAKRLLDRFEAELSDEIKQWGEHVIRENEELFRDNPGSKIRVNLAGSTILANVRDNLKLRRRSETSPEKVQNLNISLRWVDPSDWDEQDVDGTLCAACYKINNGAADDFTRVRQRTKAGDWNIRFGTDQYNNAPGVLYIPVETASDFRDAREVLTQHFTEFGGEYGEEP
jgi:hypothetical protein